MAETPYILANNLAAKAVITGQADPDAKFRLARLVDGKRYTRWQSTDTVLKNLDFDVPALYQRPVTSLVIDRKHTLAGVPLRFLYSDNGSAYTEIDAFTPPSNAVIFRRYAGQIAHRYYRLELGASAELHRIYQIWFGEGWSLEFPPELPFDGDAARLVYDDFETESGVALRSSRFEKRTIDLPMKLITPAEYARLKTFFSDVKTYGGFLWYVELPDTAPADILYMIHTIKERRFPKNTSGVYRDGALVCEEVLG